MEALSYIRIYNIVGSIVCIIALITSQLYYTTSNSGYLRIAGFCQAFFLMEIANICARKSNSRYIPTVMQLVSRNFVMWIIFWYYGIINETFPIITVCWYLSDLVRYLFYAFRADTIRIVRYNLFLMTYPIGFLSEMCCLKGLYNISGRAFSYFVAFIAFIYVPGFILLFSHMLKQRKWSKRVEMSKRKKKDL